MKESEFLWEHFKFNAEQRMKAFNFFVLLSIFAVGGVFTAIEKDLAPYLLIILGLFIIVLSILFWFIDLRSKSLVRLSVPGLKAYESQFNSCSHLFAQDAADQGAYIRYTFVFRVLFVTQIIFGFLIVGCNLFRL